MCPAALHSAIETTSGVAYRNFNICPHCLHQGRPEALLSRLCEGIPMISRSDGKLFHLLLADRPIPYSAEKRPEGLQKVSVCFWHSHVRAAQLTSSTVVILPRGGEHNLLLFRQIEEVADALAEIIAESPRVAARYEWMDSLLVPMAATQPAREM